MALKLSIRPEIEKEMVGLMQKANVRSKTAYINQAIATYNHLIKREAELAKLEAYFKDYHHEGRSILGEFAALKTIHN